MRQGARGLSVALDPLKWDMDMKTTALLTIACFLLGGPGLAGHANPWASEDDVVLQKNHEVNQLKSINTPGEDEMRGNMTRSAFGKLSDDEAAPGGGANTGTGAGPRH
jgi:hypothetical protein